MCDRVFVRGFVSGKRVLEVKKGNCEGDKDKHGVFVDCSERFAFQGFYYFRGIVETQIRVLTGAFWAMEASLRSFRIIDSSSMMMPKE